MQPKHYKHVTDHITKVKCNAATCLIRPQHIGPKPDRIRQVSLYCYMYLKKICEDLLCIIYLCLGAHPPKAYCMVVGCVSSCHSVCL